MTATRYFTVAAGFFSFLALVAFCAGLVFATFGEDRHTMLCLFLTVTLGGASFCYVQMAKPYVRRNSYNS